MPQHGPAWDAEEDLLEKQDQGQEKRDPGQHLGQGHFPQPGRVFFQQTRAPERSLLRVAPGLF